VIKGTLSAALLLVMSLSAQAVERVERGQLVIENIPEIPEALAERMNQYQQARGAAFNGWLGRDGGVLIGTRFGETTQVHRVAAPLAMREQLTFFQEPVTEVAANPDGQGFLFTRDQGGNELYQLYYYDIASGQVRLLSDGRSRNTDARWSNGGQLFAYSTTRRNGRDTDIHIGTLDGKDSQPVLEREGTWSVSDWSPDDRELLVTRYISINESELYVLSLVSGQLARFNPTEEPVSYHSARFSRDGDGIYYISDQGSEFRQLRYDSLKSPRREVLSADIPWNIEEMAMSRGGTYLAFIANAGGISQLYLRDIKQGTTLPAPALPMGVAGGLEFDLSGRNLGLFINGPRNATDVYTLEVKTAQLTRWTRSETGGLDASRFAEPSLIEFPSFDGRRIPAFYYRPDAKTARRGKFPVLISIHGGPESQSIPVFSPITEFYLREMGMAVLHPNVRGSAGYGKTYLKLDNGRLREDSVKDIGALLDWIAKQPELDAERVAVIGGSYGGYMVLASMARYNERLRAGIDIVGISNFVTFLTNTSDYRRDLRRAEYGDERDPDMNEFLHSISPTRNASKITRPMFIVHGANDPRVPASEAEQMVTSMRANGGQVWYLLARDEGHGFKKKTNRDYYNNAIVLFLQQHLLRD
jgi:dipeptidyl aminopeptidase/acylaminoacyl peptidase